jgi:RNA polymerase sigma-70 factor (ECF subfamily)
MVELSCLFVSFVVIIPEFRINDTMALTENEFISKLTDWQNRLFAYLYNLLGDLHDTSDVLQETNLVLWRKVDEFEPGTNFGAWARKCAYYEALRFLRDRKRDRHLFDDELLALLADESGRRDKEESELRLALRHCLGELTPRQRRLIDRRYGAGLSIEKLAEEFEKKESAIKMALKRVRETLQVCIESKLREDAR